MFSLMIFGIPLASDDLNCNILRIDHPRRKFSGTPANYVDRKFFSAPSGSKPTPKVAREKEDVEMSDCPL